MRHDSSKWTLEDLSANQSALLNQKAYIVWKNIWLQTHFSNSTYLMTFQPGITLIVRLPQAGITLSSSHWRERCAKINNDVRSSPWKFRCSCDMWCWEQNQVERRSALHLPFSDVFVLCPWYFSLQNQTLRSLQWSCRRYPPQQILTRWNGKCHYALDDPSAYMCNVSLVCWMSAFLCKLAIEQSLWHATFSNPPDSQPTGANNTLGWHGFSLSKHAWAFQCVGYSCHLKYNRVLRHLMWNASSCLVCRLSTCRTHRTVMIWLLLRNLWVSC